MNPMVNKAASRSNFSKSLIDIALPDSFLASEKSQDFDAFTQHTERKKKCDSATSLLIKNLDYARRFVPANQSIGCLGRFDYYEDLDDGSSIIRGWLCHKKLKITDLFVSIGNLTVRSYAHRLDRWDVSEVFRDIATAGNSGFMACFEPRSCNRPFEGKLDFRAILSDGTSREGTLRSFN